jgi:hypothetical protein
MFSAAGTQSWKADRACILSSVALTTGGNAVVSSNPSLAITDVTAPGANGTRYDVMAFCPAGRSWPAESMKIPIAAGEAVYVALSGAGTVILYFT